MRSIKCICMETIIDEMQLGNIPLVEISYLNTLFNLKSKISNLKFHNAFTPLR